ncbi:hypothetical protein ACG0Z6_15275 [Roseateles sp. BYS180W]|uniref:4-amino-4-deoxy-L-arabinose transferase-like glycosyltransferase n=1 Tax=Roseateles rivi TaxID=3299028 RepID=A0ABW7FZ50_9BURK
MTLPSPALVAERDARAIPRWALLLLCAAYVLPGLFGRDPWRNADLVAYGFMASIAQGLAPWHAPAIGGIVAEGGLLPYWLGAVFIKALPWLDPAVAARIPFGLALAGVLVLVWYGCFHLARTEAAQPVRFAFGGQADTVDYARAIADGAILALLASLGLLQLGHETTPEMLQLLGMAMFVYGLAAAPYRAVKARVAVLLALPVLACSGAPALALLLGLGSGVLHQQSQYARARNLLPWLVASVLASALCAWALGGWAWRVQMNAQSLPDWLSLLAWFAWPAWLLALWTVWRWRSHWQRRHISVPLLAALVPLIAALFMDANDRALMLALPALAVLAAFALPTLQRSVSAAIDWFSVFFFSCMALFVWLYYLALHTGWPPKLLANVLRLVPGYEPRFQALALAAAILGTLAWMWLVRWRTARHRHALWKSLVLPASGVTLCWLLAMSLGLHLLNHVRSNESLVAQLRPLVPAQACVAMPQQPLPLMAAVQFRGHWPVDGRTPLDFTRCDHAVVSAADAATPTPSGWMRVGMLKRPRDRAGAGYWVLQRRVPALPALASNGAR